MGYLKRLPISIRDPFSGKTAPHIWGNIFSPEIKILSSSDPVYIWSNRREVIERGSLSLVKEFYKRIAESTIGGKPDYDYDDLNWAIQCGHKNIFWYSFDLSPARKASNLRIKLYWDIFVPIVMMGRVDWLVEYNARCPNDIKDIISDARDELMIMALQLQDAGMICELVKAGLQITELTISAAYVKIRRQISRIYGTGAAAIEAAECRKMEETLYPIVIHLQELYPNQVDPIAASLLLPHVPK